VEDAAGKPIPHARRGVVILGDPSHPGDWEGVRFNWRGQAQIVSPHFPRRATILMPGYRVREIPALDANTTVRLQAPIKVVVRLSAPLPELPARTKLVVALVHQSAAAAWNNGDRRVTRPVRHWGARLQLSADPGHVRIESVDASGSASFAAARAGEHRAILFLAQERRGQGKVTTVGQQAGILVREGASEQTYAFSVTRAAIERALERARSGG
jgi:hypothetical protein